MQRRDGHRFWAEMSLLLFLFRFADVISLGYQLICFAAQSCIYVYIVWHELILLLFLFFRIFARVDMRSMLSTSSIAELLYLENAPTAKPMIESLRASLAFSFTPT